MKIIQKTWPEYRTFEIVSDGVKVEYKTEDSYSSQLVNFEDIGFDEVIVNYKPTPLFYLLFISVFFNIILLLINFQRDYKIDPSAVMAVILPLFIIGSYWIKKRYKFKKIKFLKGKINIAFFYYKKNYFEVDNFIKEIKNAKREFIRTKYMKIDDTAHIEFQKSRFSWLLNEKYINEEEYQELLTVLNKRTIIKGF